MAALRLIWISVRKETSTANLSLSICGKSSGISSTSERSTKSYELKFSVV